MVQGNQDDPSVAEARTMMELLNALSLFSRRTIIEWLPEHVAERGITSERFMVMFELMLQPESSLKQLASSMGVSPSSMSVMVNSMVDAGLVARVTDTQDRRRVALRLSSRRPSPTWSDGSESTSPLFRMTTGRRSRR